MHGIFDKQPEDFRKDIIEENTLIVTLEAGSVVSWQKYLLVKRNKHRYRSIWRKCTL